MCLHPRDRLPAEMWAEIFRFVRTPQDLYNVIQALPFWAALLELRLHDIQIQLVFPHLVHIIEQNRKQDKNPEVDRAPYLSTNDTLNCRLVCKSWDEAVRGYYQGPLYHSYMDRSPFIDSTNLTQNQFWGVGFDKTQMTICPSILFDPEVFISGNFEREMSPGGSRRWMNSPPASHPPQTDANPFLTREWVNYGRRDGRAAVRSEGEIRDTLQAYGKHLKKFQMNWTWSTPFEAFYTAMKDWLTLTPNLISLNVTLEDYIGLGPFIILPQSATALENVIRENPLPQLPHLEVLMMTALPHPIQTELLERYQQAKSVYLNPRVKSWKWKGPHSALAPHENWLQMLLLTIRSEEDLLILGRDHHPSWPHLQHLELDFSQQHHIPRFRPDGTLLEPYTPSWKRIISWLNQNFGEAPRLANLLLCLPHYKPSQEGAVLMETQRCRLRLRKVQQLKLRLMNQTILMDFLLPMKGSLRKVVIEFMRPWREVDEDNFPSNFGVNLQEKVRWNGWLGKKLLESNLWSIFTKLNFLRIESVKGWTYRRRLGSSPIFINPDGTEETMSVAYEDDGDNEVRIHVEEGENQV